MNWALGFFKNYPYIPFFILNLFLCSFLIWTDHRNEQGKRRIYIFFIPYMVASFLIAAGLWHFVSNKDIVNTALSAATISEDETKSFVSIPNLPDFSSPSFHIDYQPETDVFTPPLAKESEESLEGKKLFSLAEKLRIADKTEEAFELYTQACILFKNSGESISEAYTSLRIASLQTLMNNTTEAKKLLLTCLERFKKAEDKSGLAIVYRELGKINYHIGQSGLPHYVFCNIIMLK